MRPIDRRHRTDAGQADIDDLDRAGEDVSVLGPVLAVEALEHACDRGLVERPVWELDSELVALPDVAQIAEAGEPGLPERHAVPVEMGRDGAGPMAAKSRFKRSRSSAPPVWKMVRIAS